MLHDLVAIIKLWFSKSSPVLILWTALPSIGVVSVIDIILSGKGWHLYSQPGDRPVNNAVAVNYKTKRPSPFSTSSRHRHLNDKRPRVLNSCNLS